jgi:hypothetical protein
MTSTRSHEVATSVALVRRRRKNGSMRIGVIPFATAAIVCLPCAAMAQVLDAVGYLDVFTEQANWPSPEAVAQDLGSTGAATRLKALH